MGDNTNKYRSLIRSSDAKNDETPSSPWVVWQNWPIPSWPTIITTTQCSTWWDLTQLESWLNTTLLDSIWRNLTQLDVTWLDLYPLIDCPPWVSTYDDKKNGLAHEGKRERGHLLCSFLMSWDYFVVSVYPRTVCKCQEGTQGCPIYEPAASHHTHPQRTQWAKIYMKKFVKLQH